MKQTLKDVLVKAMNDSETVSIQCENDCFVCRIFNVGPEIITVSVLEAGIAHIRLEAIAAVVILLAQEVEDSDAGLTV
jgi:hypothetical protein